MKILFEHESHKIMVVRGVVTSELIIDREVCDVCNGFANNQIKSFDLQGFVAENDEKRTEIRAHVDVKFFHDDVTLYYDGKLIESKKVSVF